MAQEISFSNSTLIALVDDEDYELVIGTPTKWRVSQSRRKHHPDILYARRNHHQGSHGRTKASVGHQLMHRLILDAPENMLVDHINGNGLDNRRSNLRLCTNSQNQANRHARNPGRASRFKGVTWHAMTGKWQAQIKVERKSIYLGVFADEMDAARAYNEAAKVLFGKFAYTDGMVAA